MAPVIALFDACVLYPAPLRDLLMQLAATRLFQARWTEQIHDEWTRNLAVNRPDIVDKLPRTRQLMNNAVMDCLVSDYQDLIAGLTLPDPDDRHVLAAGIKAGASVIVTFNLKHFPVEALEKFGVKPEHPDDFISHLLDSNPAKICGAMKKLRQRLKNPPVSLADYIETIERQGLPRTAGRMRQFANLL